MIYRIASLCTVFTIQYRVENEHFLLKRWQIVVSREVCCPPWSACQFCSVTMHDLVICALSWPKKSFFFISAFFLVPTSHNQQNGLSIRIIVRTSIWSSCFSVFSFPWRGSSAKLSTREVHVLLLSSDCSSRSRSRVAWSHESPSSSDLERIGPPPETSSTEWTISAKLCYFWEDSAQ